MSRRAFVFATSVGLVACGSVSPPTVDEDGSVDASADSTSPTDSTVSTDSTATETEALDTSPAIDAASDTLCFAPIADAAVDAADTSTTGMSWRHVDGLRGFNPYLVEGMGNSLVQRLTFSAYQWTGASWQNILGTIPLDYASGDAVGVRASGGALRTVAQKVFGWSGSAWTKIVDCPSTSAKCITATELESGALLVQTSVGFQRRSPSTGSWSDVAVHWAFSGYASTVSARVVLGANFSTDDGVTFGDLTASGPAPDTTFVSAVATSLGIVERVKTTAGVPFLALRKDDGTWTKPLDGTFTASGNLVAWKSRVVAMGTNDKGKPSIARSSDGGATWTTIDAPSNVTDLLGASATQVFARCSMITSICASSDDGATFVDIPPPPASSVEVFAYRSKPTPELWNLFYSAPMAESFGSVSGSRSLDDGTTWASVPPPAPAGTSGAPEPYPFLSVLPDCAHTVIAGNNIAMKRWDDSTGAWKPFGGSGLGGPLVYDAGKLLALASGRISSDLGTSWGLTGPATSGPFFGGIDASGTAWLAKLSTRALYRSVDGVSWTLTSGQTPEGSRSMFVGRDGALYAVGSAEVSRSLDGGATWVVITTTTYPDSFAVLPIGEKSTLAMQTRTVDSDGVPHIAVVISTDGGATFVDRTMGTPPVASGRATFFEGNGHVWMTLQEHGLYELVGGP